MTQVIRGNALALPLADNSVDLICTSPPYFALRSYQDAGEHYSGQIGSEATPAAFVDALIAATREMVRVVKPSGSIWVNLGDKYSSGSGGDSNLTALGQRLGTGGGQKQDTAKVRGRPAAGFRPKTLLGVPWRYALRCIDDLGLILRAEIIWSKPNGLPESVTDRVRRSHEVWFHFTREPRYYSAVDEIREGYAREYSLRDATTRAQRMARDADAHVNRLANAATRDPNEVTPPNPLGKLPGSVWTIPTEPLKVPAELGIDHFAAFPMEWPRRIIQGWSPRGVCTACGEGRRPLVSAEPDDRPTYRTTGVGSRPQGGARLAKVLRADGAGGDLSSKRKSIVGETCACPEPTAPTTPSVVLDPFGGTGTTALVAKALGRRGISVDMSADYCRLAQWRTTDEGELARALQVKKPEKQIEGQVSMFDLLDEEGGAA